MKIQRMLYPNLLEWKAKKSRKPLILRGARQVGKSTLVYQFATEYEQCILLNLEKAEHREFFEKTDNTKQVYDTLCLEYKINAQSISPILIFLDEIQESPQAIQHLRYFYEEIPEIHVIAAGSLLEFAWSKIKHFPVGRVEFLYLNPFNFQEFLIAIGNEEVLKKFKEIKFKNSAHSTLMKLFHQYLIIGGMPEIVNQYVSDQQISNLIPHYESILNTYQNDLEKYARNNSEKNILKHILTHAYTELGNRIKFKNFANSNYRSREVGEAFRQLDQARYIRLSYPSTDTIPPIQSDLNKSAKLQFLDIGLVNYKLAIQSQMLSVKDMSSMYRGAIMPQLIMQEIASLNKYNDQNPHFWVREKNQASSEVDIIYHYKDLIIPIEVKSGAVGKLRSLHQFIDQCPHDFAIRMYAGPLQIDQLQTTSGKKFELLNLPYYFGTMLPEYIKWFVEENKSK